MASVMELRDSATYEESVIAFTRKKNDAQKTFEMAVQQAKSHADAAKEKTKRAWLEVELAKGGRDGTCSKDAGWIYVTSTDDVSMVLSETSSRSTEVDDAEEDTFKRVKDAYDLSRRDYRRAYLALREEKKNACKRYLDTMAHAARELRQACSAPHVVESTEFTESTTYPRSFHKLVNVPKYTREDLRKIFDPVGFGKIFCLPPYRELEDIEFTTSEAKFQASLAKAWSRGPLCHDVNRCLYQDDAKTMEQLAPFIQHFREAFRGTKGVLKPFDGLLFRHMQLGDLQKYTKDSVVVWPTFSSCTYDESWLKAESIGNVEFEIRCYGAIAASLSHSADKYYLPCIIEDHVLSEYVYQKEVVLPPFCHFRVVNINKGGLWGQTRIFLETTQFPSVWESIRSGKAEDFEDWAKQNPELVSMVGNSFSMVNEIAKAAVAAPGKLSMSGASSGEMLETCASAMAEFGGMLTTCAAMGAPLSEVDPTTGATAVFTLAEGMATLDTEFGEALRGASDMVKKSFGKIIKDMTKSGANLTIPHKGTTVQDLVPDLVRDLEKEALLPSKWLGAHSLALAFHLFAMVLFMPQVEGPKILHPKTATCFGFMRFCWVLGPRLVSTFFLSGANFKCM